MKISDLHNKSVLLVGYGVEGKATEQFLQTHVPTAQINIADTNINPALLQKQNKVDIVIRSPGVPKRSITNPSYTTATNIFFANISNKTIGITGTKGKSTTASLIAHALNANGKKAHLVGNIGMPMLNLFSDQIQPDDLIVCELSSYQLDDIQYSPDISVIINLFPDHIPYHQTIDKYYEAKHTLLAHATADSYFVHNQSFPLLKQWTEDFSGKVIPYPTEVSIDMNRFRLKGDHNKDNIRATLAVTRLFELPDTGVLESLRSFEPLPHRLQFVGKHQDIVFYDDAISTTPESTIQALRTLPHVGTLMLGGEDRGYDFSELVSVIKQIKIPSIVLFPDSGAHIKVEMEKQGYIPPFLLETSSMKEAVAFAYSHTSPESICLLSTASPSYSIWKNFEEKGDQYQQFILAYDRQNRQQENPAGDSSV